MAAPTDGQESEGIFKVDDDYYATLNVSRTATPVEITNAFRKLSRVYHPDKHLDNKDKQNAEVLFNKIRHAHDVLVDPQRRAIYDTLGSAGLDQSGWQVSLRTKTPQEIREEYERLAKEQEERRLQQRTNPKGIISVEVDATDMFDTYYDEDDDVYEYENDSLLPHLEVGAMMIRQSVEAPLSKTDSTTLSGTLLTKNGRGDGTLAASWRHIFSNTFWTEMTVGVGSGFTGSAKAVKTLDSKHFVTAQVDLQSTSSLRPGMSIILARQLSPHTIGYLTWKEGHHESMTATFAWSNSNTNVSCDLQIGLTNSFIGVSYAHKLWESTKIRCSAKLGTIFMTVTYGCETKISELNTLGASMTVGHPQGVVLKATFVRDKQTFAFPVQLSQDVNPSAILYGTVIPLVAYFVFNKFAVQPYYARQKRAEAAKLREANRQKVAEQRKNAEASISLMKETYRISCSLEEGRSGLIIVAAEYGSVEEVAGSSSNPRTNGHPSLREVASVTIPLQVLSADSRLVLGETSKANLPGFYDPCPGEEKLLRIRYKYRNQLYEVTVNDTESLRIPQEKHLLRVT